MEEKENLIVDLTTAFSFKILKYCQNLNQEKHYHLSNQLLKSSTSIGANAREAQNSESLIDFIHKMKIAAKEGSETEYWLDVCKNTNSLDGHSELMKDIVSIKKVLSKIISTSKSKLALKNSKT